MWSSYEQYKLLKYRGGRRSDRQQKPRVIFFDNDEKNFDSQSNGQIQIETCKVRDCTARNTEMCHRRFFKDREDNAAVQKFLKAMLLINGGDTDYFDGMSGLTSENLKKIDKYVKRGATFVFDWDRTITQCEGFFHKANDADSYIRYLSKKSGMGLPNSKTALVAALCGSARYASLKNTFSSPTKVHIVTNNSLEDLIFDLSTKLFPEFPEKCEEHAQPENLQQQDGLH